MVWLKRILQILQILGIVFGFAVIVGVSWLVGFYNGIEEVVQHPEIFCGTKHKPLKECKYFIDEGSPIPELQTEPRKDRIGERI